jgi:hypothetical protein
VGESVEVGVAYVPASGEGRPISGTDLPSESSFPCAFGGQGDRHEKPEKNKDDDILFDRVASF